DVQDAALHGIPDTLHGVAGQLWSGEVARFVDENPNGSADDFRAMIDWTDKSQDRSLGTIVSLGGGQFSVVGTHVFRPYEEDQPSSWTLDVRVDDIGGSDVHIYSVVVGAPAGPPPPP